jgi:hypothetical protein
VSRQNRPTFEKISHSKHRLVKKAIAILYNPDIVNDPKYAEFYKRSKRLASLEFELVVIIKRRIFKNRIQYFVEWKNVNGLRIKRYCFTFILYI